MAMEVFAEMSGTVPHPVNALEFRGGPLGERIALGMLLALVLVFLLPAVRYGGLGFLQENLVMGGLAVACLLGFVLTASRRMVRVDGTRREVRWFLGNFVPAGRAGEISALRQERLETGLFRLSLVRTVGRDIPLVISPDGFHVHHLAHRIASVLEVPVEMAYEQAPPVPAASPTAPVAALATDGAAPPFYASQLTSDSESLDELLADPRLDAYADRGGYVLRVRVTGRGPWRAKRHVGSIAGMLGVTIVLAVSLLMRPADTTLLPWLGACAGLALMLGVLLKRVMERPPPLSVRVDATEIVVGTPRGDVFSLQRENLRGLEVVASQDGGRLVLQAPEHSYVVEEGTPDELRLVARAIEAALRATSLPLGVAI